MATTLILLVLTAGTIGLNQVLPWATGIVLTAVLVVAWLVAFVVNFTLYGRWFLKVGKD